MKIRKLFAVIVLLITCTLLQAQPDAGKRVILICIGGISAENFQYASTPTLDGIIRQGAISLKTRGVMPTEIAPNLASILGGAGPEQHGVTGNSWSIANQAFEPTTRDSDGYFTSIYTLIHNQVPKAATGMFYDLSWLGNCINPKYISRQQFIEGQVMITSVALNFIIKEKPVFTFIYYGLPAVTGSEKGFSSAEYYQSVSEIDAEIAKLTAGLQEAKMLQNTTMIVTSDVGKTTAGNLAQSTSDIEVPWIISGPAVQKNIVIDAANDLMNTSPVIARILGLKMPPEWIGRTTAEAFTPKNPKTKAAVYVPKPMCSLAGGAYPGPQQVELSVAKPGMQIYYTLDGSLPGPTSAKYTSPFTISRNCTLRAVTISGKNASQVLTRIYTFVQGIKQATLSVQPDSRHPGPGVSGLFDGLVGSSNPANKQWMGFENGDFEITFDCGEARTIKVLGIDVLHMPSECILLPVSVEFYASADGIDYKLLKTYYTSESDKAAADGLVMLSMDFDNLSSRYIRIKANHAAGCAVPGAKPWLLVSEVEIE